MTTQINLLVDAEKPISAILATYVSWTDYRWTSSQSRSDLGEKDLAVMSLGLGGECGEVAESLNDEDRSLFNKELGDVVYYWARLADYFKLELTGLAEEQAQTCVSRSDAFIELAAATGRVLEMLKKRVRDNTFDESKFYGLMKHWLTCWQMLCLSTGVTPSSMLRLNQDKIEDRYSRGVMRGSGDNR